MAAPGNPAPVAAGSSAGRSQAACSTSSSSPSGRSFRRTSRLCACKLVAYWSDVGATATDRGRLAARAHRRVLLSGSRRLVGRSAPDGDGRLERLVGGGAPYAALTLVASPSTWDEDDDDTIQVYPAVHRRQRRRPTITALGRYRRAGGLMIAGRSTRRRRGERRRLPAGSALWPGGSDRLDPRTPWAVSARRTLNVVRAMMCRPSRRPERAEVDHGVAGLPARRKRWIGGCRTKLLQLVEVEQPVPAHRGVLRRDRLERARRGRRRR